MSTTSHAHTESPLAAELLSAAGAVVKESFQGAIEKLIGALENKSEQVPYCAIVTRLDQEPTAGQAWRSCLTAWNRVGIFLDRTPKRGSARDPLDKQTRLAGGHPTCLFHWACGTYPRPSDIFRACIEHVHPSLGEHVFLLFTPNKLKEMLPTQLTGLYINERALIHVIADAHTRVQKRVPSGHPGEESLGHADTNSTPDGPTLTWRQWFMGNVKCLTAPQIAAESGHQAKNTSATASRWSSDGKIFGLRQAGQILYPAFQFKHGAPLPTIAPILQALGSDPTGWDYAFFFSTPNAYLGGKKPIDVLHDKKMEDELVRLADRHSHPADVF